MAGFIVSQRAQHGVPYAVSCRALGVSLSWFYKWKDGDRSARRDRRDRLKAAIARLFGVRKGKDGSPRIAAALRDEGWAVSENTVAALMAEMGLAARRKRGRKATTRPGKGRWRAPDLVKRSFAAAAVNTKWYGDGTEIPTGEGKLHLASVLDMGSRRVLGFGLSGHPDAELAYGALAMAVAVRGGQVPGVIMHTDYAEVDVISMTVSFHRCVWTRRTLTAGGTLSRGISHTAPPTQASRRFLGLTSTSA